LFYSKKRSENLNLNHENPAGEEETSKLNTKTFSEIKSNLQQVVSPRVI
jgi:hypothetical protein